MTRRWASAVRTAFGNSAGGQFVHRYAAVGHGPDVLAGRGLTVRFIIANPSTYLYFDRQRPVDVRESATVNRWRYGFDHGPPYVGTGPRSSLERYLARDVTIVLGALDHDRASRLLEVSPPAMAQGANRLGSVKTVPGPSSGSPVAYDAVVTIELACDRPDTVAADTIGAAWLAVARRILADGIASRYDEQPVREISLVTLVVARPDPADKVIASYAEPERLAWMHANFTDPARVAALGGADSYATRLFDYEHSGRDQVAWVIGRLRGDPATRSAAITTFQPHTDTSYIPCVSLLDFWLPGGAVELVAYAHSIDFGAKGYGNLVELAALQQHVAAQLGRPAGRLLLMVKSAHVYDTERGYLLDVLAREDSRPARAQERA